MTRIIRSALGTMIAVVLVLPLGDVYAETSANLGQGLGPVMLTEITLKDGDVVDQLAPLTIPRQVDEPLLVVYVPATRTAKKCVMKLVEPIRRRGDSMTPIRMVTILDVSDINVILGWFVKRVFRKDRAANPSKRVAFWMDDNDAVRRAWRVSNTECRYSLYHPTDPPLSGAGMPSKFFLRQLIERITRPKSARAKHPPHPQSPKLPL